jgi:N-acetyl-gamma-glutamylphosphate reductase
MPPLIFLAVVGAAGYAGFKLFSKLVEQAQTPSPSETERVRREANAARRAATGATRDLGELELDEKDGVYKPKSVA